MRFRFIQQNTLDTKPIRDVQIDKKSQHELPPLLAALQHIFTTAELNEKVCAILEARIMADKKFTGRLGMSLWEILVLGSVRLSLNIDYAFLQDLANNHDAFRGILGVQTDSIFKQGHIYKLSTIKENVALLDEATLKEISLVVVNEGHNLLKKNEKIAVKEGKIVLKAKSDTFPAAANVHFPTDMNLLWDSQRKSLDIVVILLRLTHVKGWRKIYDRLSKLKECYRETSEIHRKKGHDYKIRLAASATKYLDKSKEISLKIKSSIDDFEIAAKTDIKVLVLLVELKRFMGMLDKHVDLLERRVIHDEKIPHSEKVFSIFEEHAEWLTKGKLYNGVVIGHNVLITTDQFQFILDHHVAEKEVDKQLAIGIGERVAKNYSATCYLDSLSIDRGFFSALAKEILNKIFEKVIMPKPGKKSAKIAKEEGEENYVNLRKKHSAVESNINELRHTGIDFVPDRGLDGFKDYVAMGVLAYNLKRLGLIVIAQKQPKPIKVPRQKAAA